MQDSPLHTAVEIGHVSTPSRVPINAYSEDPKSSALINSWNNTSIKCYGEYYLELRHKTLYGLCTISGERLPFAQQKPCSQHFIKLRW